MSFVAGYSQINVTSTPTLILASNPERLGCLINNTDSATVYLGFDANVSITTGLPLIAGATLINSGQTEMWRGAIYGVTASTTVAVAYWEWGGT